MLKLSKLLLQHFNCIVEVLNGISKNSPIHKDKDYLKFELIKYFKWRWLYNNLKVKSLNENRFNLILISLLEVLLLFI